MKVSYLSKSQLKRLEKELKPNHRHLFLVDVSNTECYLSPLILKKLMAIDERLIETLSYKRKTKPPLSNKESLKNSIDLCEIDGELHSLFEIISSNTTDIAALMKILKDCGCKELAKQSIDYLLSNKEFKRLYLVWYFSDQIDTSGKLDDFSKDSTQPWEFNESKKIYATEYMVLAADYLAKKQWKKTIYLALSEFEKVFVSIYLHNVNSKNTKKVLTESQILKHLSKPDIQSKIQRLDQDSYETIIKWQMAATKIKPFDEQLANYLLHDWQQAYFDSLYPRDQHNIILYFLENHLDDSRLSIPDDVLNEYMIHSSSFYFQEYQLPPFHFWRAFCYMNGRSLPLLSRNWLTEQRVLINNFIHLFELQTIEIKRALSIFLDCDKEYCLNLLEKFIDVKCFAIIYSLHLLTKKELLSLVFSNTNIDVVQLFELFPDLKEYHIDCIINDRHIKNHNVLSVKLVHQDIETIIQNDSFYSNSINYCFEIYRGLRTNFSELQCRHFFYKLITFKSVELEKYAKDHTELFSDAFTYLDKTTHEFFYHFCLNYDITSAHKFLKCGFRINYDILTSFYNMPLLSNKQKIKFHQFYNTLYHKGGLDETMYEWVSSFFHSPSIVIPFIAEDERYDLAHCYNEVLIALDIDDIRVRHSNSASFFSQYSNAATLIANNLEPDSFSYHLFIQKTMVNSKLYKALIDLYSWQSNDKKLKEKLQPILVAVNIATDNEKIQASLTLHMHQQLKSLKSNDTHYSTYQSPT
jgi:hypothetical protein